MFNSGIMFIFCEKFVAYYDQQITTDNFGQKDIGQVLGQNPPGQGPSIGQNPPREIRSLIV